VTPARERLLVVVGAVLAGAGAVLASTRAFATATVVGEQDPVVVTGQQAAPALAPLGIVALSLALALTIAGPVARAALGGLLVLLGAGMVATVLPSVLDDAAGTRGAISAVTGVTDVAALVTARTGTAWPVVGAVAGVLAALLGVVVLVRGRRWTTGGRRYRADVPAARSTDPIAEWDALTRGTDPTDDRTPAPPDR
jgi:hypothetical protein